MTSTGQVSLPTSPSTVRLCSAWKARTAASVCGPKTPSATSGSVAEVAVADGGACVTVAVAEASSAGSGVSPAEPDAPSDMVAADADVICALSRYWMLRTFSPVEPGCSRGHVNAIDMILSNCFLGLPESAKQEAIRLKQYVHGFLDRSSEGLTHALAAGASLLTSTAVRPR